MAKVLIDPGHAPGNTNRGPTGYYEYAGMWKLSNYLKSALEARGVTADLTRTENQDPTLAQRGGKAKGYDLFISEHSNAVNGQVQGCEVYYSIKRPNDRIHAQALAKTAADLMGNPNRGAKTRQSQNNPGVDYYGVIRHAVEVGCPHVFLAESGFHDNPIDEAWLKNDNNLKRLAEAQAEVICKILGVKKEMSSMAQNAVSNTPSSWAKDAWEWAKKEGFLDGTRSKDPVTREELAVVLQRLVKKLG